MHFILIEDGKKRMTEMVELYLKKLNVMKLPHLFSADAAERFMAL